MPLQIPQLDDRDFKALVEEATARIPVHTPEWNNFNDSDPGMTLLQVFAFMNENLLYRSNRMPEAVRIKFLALLGIGLQAATPGKGLVVINNDRGPVQAATLLSGAEVLAGTTLFRTLNDVNILPVSTALFYKRPETISDEQTLTRYQDLYSTFVDGDPNSLVFYETEQLLPPEIGKPLPELDLATTQDGAIWMALIARTGDNVELARKALARQTLAIGIYPTDKVEQRVLPAELSGDAEQVDDPRLIFEVAAPELGVIGLAPARYTRLPIEYAEDVLNKPGIVQVTLPDYDALNIWDFDPIEEGTGDYPPRLEDRDLAARIVTWIRISLPKDDADKDKATKEAVLSWLGINATRVIQAIPIDNEILGKGSGAPNQIFQVARTPVLVSPIGAASTETPFTLEIRNDQDEWEVWARTDDLYAARPDDKRYMLDPESGQIRFGDGLRGLRPGFGQSIRASYFYGGGEAGNVNIGAINKSPELPGGYKVKNPLPTWGASSSETPAEGQARIPSVVRNSDRLVTETDFREIARSTPSINIARVEVLPQFNPNAFTGSDVIPAWPGAVTIMVVPAHNIASSVPPVADRQFLQAVCDHVAPRRLVTTEIYVRSPLYVKVWVSVGLVVMPGQVRSIVRRDVKDAIREYLSPVLGGPRKVQSDGTILGGEGWELSMEIRQQDLEAVAVRVPGVRYVTGVLLGIEGSGGEILRTTTKRIRGLELPWLMDVMVSEGDAESLDNFVNRPTEINNAVAVPVVPQEC